MDQKGGGPFPCAGLRVLAVKRVIAATSIAAFALAVSTAPAVAAGTTVTDSATLMNAVGDNCDESSTVALGSNISGTFTAITIECDVTLDLKGHTLDLNHIWVDGSNHLTITDTGEDGELNVSAWGRPSAAIGVDAYAELTIAGGTITAIAYDGSAGIGSSHSNGLPAGTITITGDAHVTAVGGSHAAGIGGGHRLGGAFITISGTATVVTTGSDGGAGIGGGEEGTSAFSVAGKVLITGNAHVTANGGTTGPGIGGGELMSPSWGHDQVAINGSATVIASGGSGAAGIGGSAQPGSGVDLVIADTATVIATGGDGASAIGAGGSSDDFGSLLLDATLHVPSGELRVPSDASFTIAANGKLLGTVEDPTTGATITGDGEIDNGGVIALDDSLVDVGVTGHNYVVTFDAQDGLATKQVHLFAPSFEVSHPDWVTPPAASAWNTADDGTGDWFTASTGLAGDITVFAVAGFPFLAHQVKNCADGDLIALNSDTTGDVLTINCNMTLDLAGHTFNLNHMKVNGNNHLTITDSGETGELHVTEPGDGNAAIEVEDDASLTINDGTITATGGYAGAGIGGGTDGDGGVIAIEGTAEAWVTGGVHGAGIGGGQYGAGGVITITDSAKVTASSLAEGAGIGDGASHSGGGAIITISGAAAVTADGGASGAGIGGGLFGTPIVIAINDHATVTATGGDYAAGIGGSMNGSSGDITIGDFAEVIATGGRGGAGVGSGQPASAASINSPGCAVITATGGQDGAGIGGGQSGGGGHITVGDSAEVTALGGANGAGIGGGAYRNGGSIAIGDAAKVTAVGGAGASAVGSGVDPTNFGSLKLNATLHVPSGELQVPDGGSFTIGPEGELLGTEADPTTGATITGDGEITNGGVIALDESLVNATVDVTGHNFVVTFDAQDGTATERVHLFAPNFDVSYRDWIAPPEQSAWNTADDGSGDWFTSTTENTGDMTVFATTGPATDLTLTAPTTTVDQGNSLTFTVTATDVNGNPVNTADAVLTSSVPTDIISGTTITFVDASPHVITVTLGDAQSSLTIEVTPAAVPDPSPSPDPTPTPNPTPAPDPDGATTPDVEPAPDTTPAPAATPALAPGTGGDELSATGTNPTTGGFGILALLLLAAGSALLVTRRTAIN